MDCEYFESWFRYLKQPYLTTVMRFSGNIGDSKKCKTSNVINSLTFFSSSWSKESISLFNDVTKIVLRVLFFVQFECTRLWVILDISLPTAWGILSLFFSMKCSFFPNRIQKKKLYKKFLNVFQHYICTNLPLNSKCFEHNV